MVSIENNKLIRELSKKIRYEPMTGRFFRKVYFGGRAKSGVMAGYAHSLRYWVINYKRKSIRAHRLAWFISYGTLPPVIDHIDGDGLNNKLNNLRESSPSLNARNRKRHRNGFLLGTCYCKSRKKWLAGYRLKGKRKHIGVFDTMESAHKAYLKEMKR